jgi:uncharacterized phage protein gp47/JayE
VTFTPRLYPEVVRDLLTTLTGGTVRESLTVPPGDDPIPVLLLRDRPVRRVSHLTGRTRVRVGPPPVDIDYRFTDADFELVSTSGDAANPDAIRFRDRGRRPVPGTPLVVNYYPVQTRPVPLTDLNVGSVVRTLVETVGLEVALLYQHLDHVYRSAFVETAEGASLDKVVALVGITRLPPGVPVAAVRFTRRQGTAGRITVPVGTPVTDAEGNRYLTLAPLTMEPGESVREVLTAGEAPGTATVAEGALDRLEVAVAGVSEVTNPQPARTLAAPETDDELRRRAAGALHGVVRGTVDALRFGLLSVPGVNDVTIAEAPGGVPGEIRIDVAYGQDTPEVRAEVDRRIGELRPAGIRVVTAEATRRRVQVRVELTLAGSSLPPAEAASLIAGVEERLASHLADVPPGGTARRSRLSALALQDERVADARVVLVPEDGSDEVEELPLAPGDVLDVVRPFVVPAPAFEEAPGAGPAVTARVSALLPVHLVPGVTVTEATQVVTTSFDAFLSSRGGGAPLTVDALAAAIRDDSRFALVRAEAMVTVESDGRFLQLTDGTGAYTPAVGQTLRREALDLQPREGGL